MDHALDCVLFQNNLRWRPDDDIKSVWFKIACMKKHNILFIFTVLLNTIVLRVKPVVLIVKVIFFRINLTINHLSTVLRLFKALFKFFKHNEKSQKIQICINIRPVVLRIELNLESFEQVFKLSEAYVFLFKDNKTIFCLKYLKN